MAHSTYVFMLHCCAFIYLFVCLFMFSFLIVKRYPVYVFVKSRFLVKTNSSFQPTFIYLFYNFLFVCFSKTTRVSNNGMLLQNMLFNIVYLTKLQIPDLLITNLGFGMMNILWHHSFCCMRLSLVK